MTGPASCCWVKVFSGSDLRGARAVGVGLSHKAPRHINHVHHQCHSCEFVSADFFGPALFKFPWWRKSCFEAHTQVTAWATLQSFEHWDGSEALVSLSGHDGLQTLLVFRAGMAISSSETTHCLTSCFTRSKMNGGAFMWVGGSRFLWALTVVKLPSVSIRAVTAPWATLLHPPFWFGAWKEQQPPDWIAFNHHNHPPTHTTHRKAADGLIHPISLHDIIRC